MDYNEKARVLCKKIQEIRYLEDLTNPETFKHDFPLALEFGLSNLTKIGMVVAQVLGEKQKRVFTANGKYGTKTTCRKRSQKKTR